MFFSVVIPLYNKAPYVEKALRSVAAQTFTDWELIVVDDGSTDNSAEVAKSVLDGLLQKTQLICQRNAGVSTARNMGVSVASGEYVCFLDADDWWDEQFLNEMALAIRQFPDAGIYGSNYWYVKNNQKRICVKSTETGYFDYIKNYLFQYDNGGGMPFWTGAVVIQKSIFEELGGFKPHLRLGEDFDLWLRVALRYKTVFVDKPLAYYNQDADAQFRAVKKLHEPENTELAHYADFAEEERINANLKLLLDRKRAIGLYRYYLSNDYRHWAQQELAKIDWVNQPSSFKKQYEQPIWCLKLKDFLLRKAVEIKNKHKKRILRVQ